MEILAAVVVLIGSLAGVVLTLLVMPGIWIAIAIALLVWWWQPDMFSIWSIAAAVAVGVVAEILELAASAFGARKAGGSRGSAIGSVIGAIGGALLGTVVIPLPVVGTIVGCTVGAGMGAIAGEMRSGEHEIGHYTRVGGAAAAGRLIATFIKTSLAVVVAAILSVAAFV